MFPHFTLKMLKKGCVKQGSTWAPSRKTYSVTSKYTPRDPNCQNFPLIKFFFVQRKINIKFPLCPLVRQDNIQMSLGKCFWKSDEKKSRIPEADFDLDMEATNRFLGICTYRCFSVFLLSIPEVGQAIDVERKKKKKKKLCENNGQLRFHGSR